MTIGWAREYTYASQPVSRNINAAFGGIDRPLPPTSRRRRPYSLKVEPSHRELRDISDSISAAHEASMLPVFTDEESEVVSTVIRSRRTIHLFEEGSVPPREEILVAIDHARWAPNHHLTEPWRFYLLGGERAEAIARLNAKHVAKERGEAAGQAKLERWLRIPGWLVVTCRRSDDVLREREDYAACCCAIQNLQLYLWSRGIGVKWTTGSVTRLEQFFEILEIDREAERLVAMLWYGYPADIPKPPRKPVKEILSMRP